MTGAILLLVLAQEPQAPLETVRQLQVPEGFTVKLFAGEPDLVQPISFAIDDRGRIWVAENRSYPQQVTKDRILVFEDADGDGAFDRRGVFCEGLSYVTGMEVGFGGVWVIAPPRMLFIPDRDGDGRADGPPETLLDGFGLHGIHNIANGFTWGPDGWLYAGHGRTSISDVGKPGTPPGQRIHYDGGVWRYHPTRHVFEPFCDGTTNPWGIAFDERGQAFMSTCVERHLYHAIQGGHFEPWRGRTSSLFAFRRIDSIADHFHFRAGTMRGNSAELLEAGGGHAHCGTMVYLGDSFPDAYRGSIFMNNLHGHRVNNDYPKRRGSGFTASHGRDFLVSADRMHMGLSLQYGPDGAVWVSDWYDRGECHTRKPHEETGRIYKVQYGKPAPFRGDLARLSDEELVGLQLHRNDWHVTHARRLLQERASVRAQAPLRKILEENPDVTRKLRALWALHATGGLPEELLHAQLSSPEEYLRAWAVQLEMEDRRPCPAALSRMVEMARSDPSPVVRLYLASACQRMTLEERWPIVERLADRSEDAEDPNLPLMVWYAAEPMGGADPARAIEFIRRARLPIHREFMSRRLAASQR
jgi:putative membrane-bound dehydrogenase-like protein